MGEGLHPGASGAKRTGRNSRLWQVCGAGAWVPLARSTGGGPFAALLPNVSVQESSSGNTRSVSVTDACSGNDPAHPQRFCA